MNSEELNINIKTHSSLVVYGAGALVGLSCIGFIVAFMYACSMFM
jgi:hypothetical protein